MSDYIFADWFFVSGSIISLLVSLKALLDINDRPFTVVMMTFLCLIYGVISGDRYSNWVDHGYFMVKNIQQ